jgi:RNA polymerase sigma-70 factor (ECF subfamily)
VDLARDGNTPALEQLCAVYGERIHRITRLRMGRELRSKLDSMDIVQEALISIVKDLDKFTYKNEGDFLRWTSKIVENRIRDNVDKFHAAKRDMHREVHIQDRNSHTKEGHDNSLEPMRVTTPSVLFSKKEELDKLESAIDKLKPEYRMVIISVKIEGLSLKEIGDKMNKSADAVRMLISRAMASLTEIFERIQ